MLTLVIGGARSGKSRFAQSLAAASRKVAYIATARRDDDEMAARIDRHRQDRPGAWVTVEAPLEIAAAVETQARECDFILLDCLTIWLSNFSWEHRNSGDSDLEAAISREIGHLCAAAAGDGVRVAVVTNELGCGLVPETPVGRRFRDLHGWMNQDVARAAGWVYHVVAGIAAPIKHPESGQ